MLDEQVNAVIDTITSVPDSVVMPASLFEETVSLRPLFPLDTMTRYVGLVEGIPISGEKTDISVTSGMLVYTVIYLIFIALLRLRGRSFLTLVYTYFFNRKKGAGLQSEGIGQSYLLAFLSVCFSYSILSILISFLIGSPFLFSNALLIFLVIMGYYAVFVGFVRFFGWVFNARHCASEIVLNLRTSAIVLGLSISPFVLAIFYVQASATPILLHVILGVSVIILIFRFIRLIKILYGYRVSILYMILYLCGLEILPILVLYKLLG